MGKQKISIHGMREKKIRGQKLTMVTAYDYTTAALVDGSPIDMILVGDSLGMVVLGYDGTVPVTMDDMIHHIRPVVRGARNTFIVGDMPFGSYNESISQAVHNANRIMKEGGADAIKLEGGLSVVPAVKALVDGGIAVMGHIGLTPQTASLLGGFKVQGRDTASAERLLTEAVALEEAGAFSIVMECIPTPLAKLISEKVAIPTIGIGAGVRCDGQVLVYHDLLGLYDRFLPRFVKQYAKLGPEIARALEEFTREVENRAFPAPEHSFTMEERLLEKLK